MDNFLPKLLNSNFPLGEWLQTLKIFISTLSENIISANFTHEKTFPSQYINITEHDVPFGYLYQIIKKYRIITPDSGDMYHLLAVLGWWPGMVPGTRKLYALKRMSAVIVHACAEL